jgi:hypothetical protein
MYQILTNFFLLLIIVSNGHQLEWTKSEFLSKAINISRNAIETIEKSISIPPHDVTVIHIVDALSIKRLYRIVSASSQLTKFKHIVLYWTPETERSRTALQDIATLYEILPAGTIRVIDFQHFDDLEKAYMSNNCSRSELNTLLTAEYHRMESCADNTKGNHSLYWLLDIDVNWIGDISLILNKLNPPLEFSSPFASLLSGIEGIESIIDARITDFVYFGISHIERNTIYSSTETLHKVKLKFNEIKNAYDQKLNDLDQFVSGTFETIVNLLNFNNSQSVRNKTVIAIEKKEDPFYWPEISRFSGNFLGIIRNSTFSLIHSVNKSSNHNDSRVSYLELIDNNKLKTYNALEYGLKESLLAKDFVIHTAETIPIRVGLESNQNSKDFLNGQEIKSENEQPQENIAQCFLSRGDSNSYIHENEFESLKVQFQKDSSELFLFEKKAGTIFRYVIESR